MYFCFIPLNSGSPLRLEPVGRIYSYAAIVIGESLGGPLSTASADSALRTLVVQTMRKGGRDKPQRICKLTNTLEGGGLFLLLWQCTNCDSGQDIYLVETKCIISRLI